MKKQSIIILIVVVVLVIIAIAFGVSAKKKVDQSNLTAQNVCFQKITKQRNGSSTEEAFGATLTSNHKVGGQIYFVPALADSLLGTFSGTWQENGSTTVLNVEHTYAAGEDEATATIAIIIQGDSATIDWKGLKGQTTSQKLAKVPCIL